MAADTEAPSPRPPPSFVEVYTADGRHRRFAAGTKAGFALDRINRRAVDTARKYSFIECIKEGEDTVEFGPDAELVTYGDGWQLCAVCDVEVSKSPTTRACKTEFKEELKDEAKEETKAPVQPGQKVFDPADFYPGGKLPDGPQPETAVRNFILVIIFMFTLGGCWVYVLESNFFAFA